jgi:hypothetical protein
MEFSLLESVVGFVAFVLFVAVVFVPGAKDKLIALVKHLVGK